MNSSHKMISASCREIF